MILEELVKGKKILFICPVFQHYHTLIQEELVKNGADVLYIPTYKEPVIKRLLKKDLQAQLRKYYDGFKQVFSKNKFAYIFVIKGDGFTEQLVQQLQTSNCKKILYQWDSLKNWDYRKQIPLYDKIFSFDSGDCERDTRIKYYPLFYSKENNEVPSSLQYDIITVGGYSTWRYSLVEAIYDICKRNNLSAYFKMVIPFRSRLKNFLKGQRPRQRLISFSSISKDRYDQLLSATTTVLDVPSPGQTGLSIRTIETIAAKRKLITTNKNILKEEFYSTDNILILEEGIKDENAILDFIRKKSTVYPDISHLLLEKWLVKILS